MNKEKIKYIKNFGVKATMISEFFKENELKGKTINDTQSELLVNGLVGSRMLSEYTNIFRQSKDDVVWIANN